MNVNIDVDTDVSFELMVLFIYNKYLILFYKLRS